MIRAEKYKRQIHLMLSSDSLTDTELLELASAVGVALCCIHKSEFLPVIVRNADDDFFGKSVDVHYSYFAK